MKRAAFFVLVGLGTLLTLSFAEPVRASDVMPAVVEVPAVEGGLYHVDGLRTQVVFSVSCLSVSWYHGLFSGVSGSLQLDSAHPEQSHVALRLPVQSLTTTSGSVTETLWDEGWLDVRKYPDATFVSTQIVSDGLSQAKVAGRLTLHGVTRPVTLHVHFVGAGKNPMDHDYTVGFEAHGTIQRSAFGIRNAMAAVGDDVKLTLTGVFEKSPSGTIH
ncbi:YceI family protein [Acetobacter cerevisiae]|uniref:YceI family protein n=2 Tax=Acetobacter cerevisiae TaxID=178900 RepID=A0ABT1ESE3_9PROT|nr:YceI family protein [Acetobacter cerevisiae]MCP1246298.1 YceI family protein [Acetobacter cerevisiae]MCP1255760.1 YceI family protein [Acetobacter cerevisiae]